MTRKILGILLGCFGLGLVFLSVFAQPLGVSRDSDWGPGRIIVAVAGCLFIFISFFILAWRFIQLLAEQSITLLHQWQKTISETMFSRYILKCLASLRDAWNNWLPVRRFKALIAPQLKKFYSWVVHRPVIKYFIESQDRKAYFTVVVLGLIVLGVYVFLISVGYWTNWPKTTSYYQLLGDAFIHGQASLLIDPDPDLLNLSDPYTYANRENISYPWDVVFFQGKFYLYWGPVPALVASLVRSFARIEVGDHALAFLFVSGVFVFSTCFILRLRSRFFPNLRWAYVIPGILLAGFANPMPWLLNRPAVYEAAIASGQFFLIAGLFFGFLALAKLGFEPWKLILSGSCLALAVASRASLAFTAAFLVVMITGYMVLMRNTWACLLLRLLYFSIPFIFILAAMGWYNQVRFGDWFEFGFQYQLTGMNTHIQTFSMANLPINLHNYFLNPYRILPTFPYVKPDLGGHFIFFPITSPANYYSEDVTGLLLSTPFLVFAGVPIFYLLWYAWEYFISLVNRTTITGSWMRDGYFLWMVLTLVGASLFAFIPILVFISGTMRYLADVVPLLVLLSAFGLFMGRQYLEGKSTSVFWFNFLVVVLTVYSITVSLLLAVTGAEARFEHLNPILFDKLTRWFTP